MKPDYNELLEIVSEMGFRLMLSGAEIYRVEESFSRLLQAYGAERGEVLPSPTASSSVSPLPRGSL